MLGSWDINLRCRFANRAYQNWFGVQPADLLGRPIQGLLGPKIFQLNEPHIRRALTGEEQLFERSITGPDGVTRHSLARYTPEFSDGQVIGFFVEVNDVSPLKAVEAALQRKINELEASKPRRGDDASMLESMQKASADMSARLDAKQRRESQFLVQLGHELRNALSPMRLSTHLICQPGPVPGAVIDKARATLLRSVSHMARLVSDILDVGGIDIGVLSLVRQRIDVRDVLGDAMDMCMPDLRTAGHTFQLEVQSEPLFIDADHGRLVQVFSNLIGNAVKYTPAGGRITVRANDNGDSVSVSVEDTGIGLPSDSVESVFGLFNQLSQSSSLRKQGLGVGLALVKQIVQAHDGSVKAASHGPGLGSTFVVTLPTRMVARE